MMESGKFLQLDTFSYDPFIKTCIFDNIWRCWNYDVFFYFNTFQTYRKTYIFE